MAVAQRLAQSRRSLLTMAAIAFAVLLLVFMLSFQFGSYEAMIDSAVRLSTGHVQVQAKGYNDNPEIRKVVERSRGRGTGVGKTSRALTDYT